MSNPYARDVLDARGILLLVGLLFGFTALFTGWWVHNLRAGDVGEVHEYRPFNDMKDGTSPLKEVVVLTGVYAVLAFAGLTFLFVLELFPEYRARVPFPARASAFFLTMGLGLWALGYTYFEWPAKASEDLARPVEFFDTLETGVQAKTKVYAGLGWYFGWFAFLVLPAVAFYFDVRARREEAGIPDDPVLAVASRYSAEPKAKAPPGPADPPPNP